MADAHCIKDSVQTDYIIGNPPFQEETKNKRDRATPLYDKFIYATYQIGDVVELIHPARFLSNAGQTLKELNKKMLNDEHLKVIYYEQDASKVFPNTEIKGGVAIAIHDANKVFEPIGEFSINDELSRITKKVSKKLNNF